MKKLNHPGKNFLLNFLLIAISTNILAQRDIIYKNDSTQIRCKITKATADKYQYTFLDSTNKIFKTNIFKTLVDSVSYDHYDSNLVQNKIFNKKTKPTTEAITPVNKHWKFTVGLGLNVENIIEFNSPGGTDKKSLSGNCSLDAGADFAKENSRVASTNEIHYIFGIQRSPLSGTAHLQRVTDNITTLHDLSVAIGKTKKWNFNMIVKTATSIFTIYDGDYFKDINHLGRSQSFLSPYDITVSPGIKWQPDKYLRISISPYSFNLYGVRNQQVSSKGVFITELDASGNYKRNLFKRLGAEINIWYDRKIKSWLDIQYRVGISSNYFEKIAKNGLLDGLFITNIKLIKNLYLTHRASLKGDFAVSPFNPWYNQSILLSYSRRF